MANSFSRGFQPDWPAPKNVRAFISTRSHGVSLGCYAGLNVGAHVGDNIMRVKQNRALLKLAAKLPSNPSWLNQTHSNIVTPFTHAPVEADAIYAEMPNQICNIMTADCLPILLCNKSGNWVAAIHGGWRSLAGGIITNTIQAYKGEPQDLMAYLGPAIGPSAFEVGEDVKHRFSQLSESHQQSFRRISSTKYLADIYQIAKQQLQLCGVTQIFGGQFCTYRNPSQYYSYRRDGQTGRMASMVWLEVEK